MVKNITEMVVEKKLDVLLERDDKCCKCQQCREDILVYTLNHLSPHYVSTDQGQLYSKAKTLSIHYDVEILTALTKSIKLVTEHPRH